MIEPATLDPKIPTRSVDFVEALRVLILADEKPRTYTELLDLARSNRVIVGSHGESLKKSSFHRNWKTLEVLGLIHKDGQFHRPTRQGQSVLAAFRDEGETLGDKTKYLLRQAMLSSEVARQNFFALFAIEQTYEPLECTGAVALVPTQGEGFLRRDVEYRIQNVVTEVSHKLTNRQVQGIIWGLMSWAMELGLADRLYARPQDGIPKDLCNIVFLVNPDKPLSEISRSFAKEIENLVEHGEVVYGNTVRVPISWLLYHVCPRVQISTSVARKELVRWLKINSHRAFVEGASQPVVKNVRQTNRAGARISWKSQELALLEMDGRYYTYLFCQRQTS